MKQFSPTKAAPKVKPATQADQLYVKSGSQQAEKLAAWLRIWGFSGELIAEAGDRYFDIRQPEYWSAERRRLFRAGLKRQTAE